MTSSRRKGETEDPGDGIDVARFLAARLLVCPVIVHSSNGTRSDWMIGEFELGGGTYKRVAPIGDDWIEAYWRVVVGKLLDRDSMTRNRPVGFDSRHVQDVEKGSDHVKVPGSHAHPGGHP